MAVKYSNHVNTRVTPQTQPILGREADMARNNAGGYSFAVDKWTQLTRFIVLGSEGGSYYATEQKLTKENATNVLSCIKENGVRAVNEIVDISFEGRAPKNDPAVFALALSASFGDEATKRAAYAAVPKVCRIGTHIFAFADAVNGLRGWGSGLRKAIARWYTEKSPSDLAYQLVKYGQRDGWSHNDLLRLSHPVAAAPRQVVGRTASGHPLYKQRPTDDTLATMFRWVKNGWEDVGDAPHPNKDLHLIWAFEKAKRSKSVDEVVRLIRDYRLPREAIPTQYLNEAKVWEALLQGMPLGALLRNLGNLSKAGVVATLSAGTKKVVEAFGDADALRRARIHPIAVLMAMKQYAAGHGLRGKGTWNAVPQVIDALDAAFYAAFRAVEPTGKRFLLGLDVSGSMGGANVVGCENLTAREASAAFALVTAATESQHAIMGFSNRFMPLNISPRQRLTDAVKAVSNLPFEGTDCALPMIYAMQNKLPVDVFVILTDNDTAHGRIHPTQALRQYREAMGIPAKLLVQAFSATNFSVADPTDRGQMDIAGLDTNVPQVIREFVLEA